MKKIVIAAAVAVLFAASAVKVVDAAEAQALKFGYVDFQRVLNKVEDGQRAQATLKKDLEESQKKIDALQNELQAMKTDYDKQRLILSGDALKGKEEAMNKKIIELRQKAATYEQDFTAKEGKLTGEILAVVQQLVAEIGQREGYTSIMEKSQGILYAPAGSDLTEKTIKEYNAMPKAKKDQFLKNASAAPGRP